MKLVANTVNGTYLRDCLPPADADVDSVLAAIAYGSDSTTLLKNCIDNKYRMDIWMRYDHSVPVSTELLRRLLTATRHNVFTFLIPDIHHSKVIWWKGYGAYIGSANLTDRAWITNIEAGLFLTQDDLEHVGIDVELELFFANIRSLDAAFPLSQETIEEMEEIEAAMAAERQQSNDKALKKRRRPMFDGIQAIGKKSAVDKAKAEFGKEWLNTLTILRHIAERAATMRPSWVAADTPTSWQADQFLHAYYYNQVRDGVRHPFDEFHQANRKNPELALTEALRWWQDLESPPTSEDHTFDVSAPFIYKALSNDNIQNTNAATFAKICEYTHATKDHVSKIPLPVLGIYDQKSLPLEERIPLFARWLLNQRNREGMNVLQVIEYVLYGGADHELWERLFAAGWNNDSGLKINRYGLNSLAELTGWARPDAFPPRNGRTSKALRALGYPVDVY